MKNQSAAGLIMVRTTNGDREYLLVHPGGPYFAKKDTGFWTIPKGLPEEGEDLLATAQREFFEETGIVPAPPYYSVGSVRQKSGKIVHAWAFEGEWDPATGIQCNHFTLEWPPRSGKQASFPEVDKAQWMSYAEAVGKIIPEQRPFLERMKSENHLPPV